MKNTTAVSNPLYPESQSFLVSPHCRVPFRSHRPEPGPCRLFEEKQKLKNSVYGFLVSEVEERKEKDVTECGGHDRCSSSMSKSLSYWECVALCFPTPWCLGGAMRLALASEL